MSFIDFFMWVHSKRVWLEAVGLNPAVPTRHFLRKTSFDVFFASAVVINQYITENLEQKTWHKC
jgi:hypothetical protein